MAEKATFRLLTSGPMVGSSVLTSVGMPMVSVPFGAAGASFATRRPRPSASTATSPTENRFMTLLLGRPWLGAAARRRDSEVVARQPPMIVAPPGATAGMALRCAGTARAVKATGHPTADRPPGRMAVDKVGPTR